jgi:hypothetical protein
LYEKFLGKNATCSYSEHGLFGIVSQGSILSTKITSDLKKRIDLPCLGRIYKWNSGWVL